MSISAVAEIVGALAAAGGAAAGIDAARSQKNTLEDQKKKQLQTQADQEARRRNLAQADIAGSKSTAAGGGDSLFDLLGKPQ